MQKYTIRIRIWKQNKYGDPDENACVGEYFSENAAYADMEVLRFICMSYGVERFTFEVEEKQADKEECGENKSEV